ncbi:MAG TPA: hypothetical protein VF610_11200 [Segetibacter sp.]
MKVFIADSFDAMSRQAAEDLLAITETLKSPLLSPASGDSPAGKLEL